MATANTTIQLKKSGATGNTPTNLNFGELALNYYDGKLFYKAANGTIVSFSSGPTTESFATVNANSTLILATTPTDTLSFTGSNGISITANSISKTINIGDGITQALVQSKTQTYYQNTAPSSPNPNDLWLANTGVLYENFGNTSYPVWAEVGPTGVLANTQPGIISGTSGTFSGNLTVSGNVISSGTSGPQVRFLWDTWQANSNTALSSFTPSGTIGGNAFWDVSQANGLILTTATNSESGYINWNSNTINYNNDMTITASVGAGFGTGADGQWIYFGANAAVQPNPNTNNTGGGISAMVHYYNGANRFEVYVNGTQYNIPFINNGSYYTTSGVTLWSSSYANFYSVTIKIRKIQNGNRMLEVYLNDIYQGSVNITSWVPAGNYFGVAAYTGGSNSNNWVRQLKIEW